MHKSLPLLFALALAVGCGGPSPTPQDPECPTGHTCLSIMGFENASEAGKPDGWSSPCYWGGQVMVTTGAAVSGVNGLRMAGGCVVSSEVVDAPGGTLGSVVFEYRTVASGAASVTLQWYDASGAALDSGTATLSASATYGKGSVNVPRPAGGTALQVRIATPSDMADTADFDDFKVFVQ